MDHRFTTDPVFARECIGDHRQDLVVRLTDTGKIRSSLERISNLKAVSADGFVSRDKHDLGWLSYLETLSART